MKTLKNLIAAILTLTLVLGLTACGGSNTEETSQESGDTETASYKIGISQYGEHGSLDNCREGFLEGLAQAGIVEGENLEVLYENAHFDNQMTTQIGQTFSAADVDLMVGIATPSAVACYNAAEDKDIPVIFTAITDPVEANLDSGNVTGTSDALPVEGQLKLIRALQPDADTIGIIYTTSEANSISTIAEYKALAGNYGFEIVDSGVTAMSEVALAAADIASKVDCITNLTDNTVVSALQTVLDEAGKAGIPVFGSEVEQVKAGCVASMGLEYIELGKQTGKMAARVLKGEAEASELNFEVISEPSLYVNFAAAEKINLELPENYKTDAYQSFDEIVVQ